MAKLKYANNIIKTGPGLPQMKGGPVLNQILMLNGESVPGAFHVNCAWISPGPNPGVFPAHKHPHAEVIGFIGTNPDDPHDLGAVAELWIGDEKYTSDQSFMAYFPPNIIHCPLIVTDVKRPILHFDIQIVEGRPTFEWVKDKK